MALMDLSVRVCVFYVQSLHGVSHCTRRIATAYIVSTAVQKKTNIFKQIIQLLFLISL